MLQAWRHVAWRHMAWRHVAWRHMAARGVAARGVAARGITWRHVTWQHCGWHSFRIHLISPSVPLRPQACGDQLNNARVAVMEGLLKHPVFSDVNWEGVQRLANFDAMVAGILDQPEPKHEVDKCWHPDRDSCGGHGHGSHGHGSHGHGSHGSHGHGSHGHGSHGSHGHGAHVGTVPSCNEALGLGAASGQLILSSEGSEVTARAATGKGRVVVAHWAPPLSDETEGTTAVVPRRRVPRRSKEYTGARSGKTGVELRHNWSKFFNALCMASNFMADFQASRPLPTVTGHYRPLHFMADFQAFHDPPSPLCKAVTGRYRPLQAVTGRYWEVGGRY